MLIKPKRALISLSDKTGIVEFASKLNKLGVEIISTGGTAKLLKENKINIVEISEFTGFPEILDGRVKTLNPKVHAGILNIRDNEAHQKTMKELGLVDIDMVVVNLYPFEKTISNKDVKLDEAIENIDIGGPTMIRSAAKNFKFVSVIVDNNDFGKIEKELEEKGGITYETRIDLARKAFTHTAVYDSIISNYFNQILNIKFPEEIAIAARKKQGMRYGENPHQEAAFYTQPNIKEPSVSTGKQLQGKELSFNNIIDINAAVEIVKEFKEPVVTIIKHTNPCGTAIGENNLDAYLKALECDPVSAFGGIVGTNREIGKELAEKLAEIFLEVVIAPKFDNEALEILSAKKNLRLIEIENLDNFIRDEELDIKKVTGGMLLADRDLHVFEDVRTLEVPTKRKPTEDEYKALNFAWKVAKHVKSNAIVYAKNDRTIGVGAGQMSRVDSSKIAADKARSPLKGCVMASDAFFPFRDSVDEAASRGITAIIQPGGSIRDKEVIQACDEHNIAMVFTGIRHFKH
ncbi:MAG: phosphoribosylaminoimidazolecarboxamide formyltransferase / cyclohydrolase [Deferribacteres bacterium]|jgi:phosphoribosylaminoimidazolecarboxamide formyltransferase/IMP cyclohydrolase|nr:phosphoribosylaminoimidazolecarboxamide formyltransferase / cyclohydrolase [Deferribacteres bacterium]